MLFEFNLQIQNLVFVLKVILSLETIKNKVAKTANFGCKFYCLINFPVLFSFTEIREGVP